MKQQTEHTQIKNIHDKQDQAESNKLLLKQDQADNNMQQETLTKHQNIKRHHNIARSKQTKTRKDTTILDNINKGRQETKTKTEKTPKLL